MRRQNISFLLVLTLVLLVIASCKDKNQDGPGTTTGKITIGFNHLVDGNPLQIDTLKYVNAAGNQYMVTEVQYFISDVTLYKSDGSTQLIDAWKDIHYVDNDIPSTMTWNVYDSIPEGQYDSLTFIFGISEEKNQSMMYVDPPESLMFWPELLGGGYHYMKLNGKWKDPQDEVVPYNFHMGIGQIYDNNGQIIGFVQNYFKVHLPASSFSVERNKVTYINLNMNIERWFETPNVFDFNYWGGAIMQNQEAMHAAAENGHDVFSMGVITIQ